MRKIYQLLKARLLTYYGYFHFVARSSFYGRLTDQVNGGQKTDLRYSFFVTTTKEASELNCKKTEYKFYNVDPL